ncbi:2-hexaprenyl-6-methoxy-1,4-benzoquinone methyltransferase [Dimargaris verticillata]|uniref:2-methoxy-6-polyprenyl-1,4-benzoquinol methylase, mitochondrial n=1 Tax=Dimargaris verticillata TaxID=2761393 RepID=A0A9W8BBM3_9FUNG|nr:2-hexaprenyl-6-methoxy-1,4-benzoquinone methyltransferase [Dimargaris verticillata]
MITWINATTHPPLGQLMCASLAALEAGKHFLLPMRGQAMRQYTMPSDQDPPKTTHFGFREVAETEKERLVGQVFSNVASKYDIMNDAMSAGVHRLWKDRFIRQLAPPPGTKLLDVAGGTGDIAMRFLNYCRNAHHDHTAHVHLVDINPEMVNVGRQRFHNTVYDLKSQVDLSVGNAEDLADIPSDSKDAYTIAFGIRNCTHVDRVVREAYRVLKPGGRFMCLEFSRVENPLIAPLYDLYSFEVIPAIGQVIASDRESYQYLVESIRRFPSQDQFADIIRGAGFSVVGKGYENLTFGIAAIHSGFKL